MAALALVAPDVFKRALEHLGWVLYEDGKLNWTMVKDGLQLPIHFNRRDQHCYLSLEGSEMKALNGGLVFTASQKVLDVDENRDVLACSSIQDEGKSEKWLCADGITR